MDTNMKATLCEQTLDNAYKAYPMLRGAILHSDRGTQYTSELYRKAINNNNCKDNIFKFTRGEITTCKSFKPLRYVYEFQAKN